MNLEDRVLDFVVERVVDVALVVRTVRRWRVALRTYVATLRALDERRR